MPYGNNRAAAKPRATFMVAGGAVIKYRHPALAGQINDALPIDEVDASRALRLSDTFLDAQPANDNAVQEVLVDGSVITITNHVLAGKMTLTVLPTTGLVGTGDLIACAHLVIASKDDTGGTLTVTRTIQGKRIVTVFYGVSWANVPHLRIAGNVVIPYSVVMLYAGWIQGVSADTSITAKTIWAVGNQFGIKAVYKPYLVQEAETQDSTNGYFSGKPLDTILSDDPNISDDPSGDISDIAIVKEDPVPSGVSRYADPSTRTWDT